MKHLRSGLPAFSARPQWLEARGSVGAAATGDACSAVAAAAAAPAPGPVTVEWQVTRAELEQLLEQARANHSKQAADRPSVLGHLLSPSSQRKYLGGVEWGLSLQVVESRVAAPDVRTLGC